MADFVEVSRCVSTLVVNAMLRDNTQMLRDNTQPPGGPNPKIRARPLLYIMRSTLKLPNGKVKSGVAEPLRYLEVGITGRPRHSIVTATSKSVTMAL